MVFSSILFLFLFLPLVLTAYLVLTFGFAALGRRAAGLKAGNLFLLAVSILFYAWGEPDLTFVMLVSILVDWVAALFISGALGAGAAGERTVPALEVGGPRTRAQRVALVLSVTTNLAFLGFFKYFNFGADSLRAVAQLAGLDWLAWKDTFHVALPIGISFYTFQSMSYTIDVYRGEACATRSLLDFACYVTLFPQLVAGPIVRYRDVAAELIERTVTSEKFASGVDRFVVGLGKKVLLANTLSVPVDKIFALPSARLDPALSWLAAVCFTLQIYYDFSGYSDMAIGMGRMLGFEFLENFDYPYFAGSIREFWQRWHISLSTWFRDYVYVPLGGNRGSRARTRLNLVLVFFLCGLWHGAAWTFIVWGLWHGLFLFIERGAFGGWMARRWPPLRHAYAMLVVVIGLVIFRSEDLAQASSFLRSMAGRSSGAGVAPAVALYLRSDVAVALALGALFCAPVVPALRRAGGRALIAPVWRLGELATLATLFVASAMSLASGTHNPFIYYRF